MGAAVNVAQLPLSPACRAYAEAQGIDPATLALAGGEDYELLFTVAPRNERSLERQARARGFHITKVGVIRPRRFGTQAISVSGVARPLPVTSYQHFR